MNSETTRLYIVTAPGQVNRLVEATSQAQAIRFVIAPQRYSARHATGKDVAQMLADGCEVEKAGEAQEPAQS